MSYWGDAVVAARQASKNTCRCGRCEGCQERDEREAEARAESRETER